jgi:hypothetical protein
MVALPKKYYARRNNRHVAGTQKKGGKKILPQIFLSGSPPPTYIPSTPTLPVFGGTRILFIPLQ